MKKLFALAIVAGVVTLTGCKKPVEPQSQPIAQTEVVFKCLDTKFSISLDDVPQEVDSKNPGKIWEEFAEGVKKPYLISFSNQLHHLNYDDQVLYFEGGGDNVRSYGVKIENNTTSNTNRLVGLISEDFEKQEETVFIHVAESKKQDMLMAVLVQAHCKRVDKKSIV